MPAIFDAIDRAAVADTLKGALASGGTVVGVADSTGTSIDVDIAGIQKDVLAFNDQAHVLQIANAEWPCVSVKWIDENGHLFERSVPIDLALPRMPPTPVAARVMLQSFLNALDPALPVVKTPISEARKNFLDGATDVISNRAIRLFMGLGGWASNPEVEAHTSPTGQQVMYTDGHFFNVATVFGNSIFFKRVPAGIYSFWTSGMTPTIALPLWHITTDTRVDV